MHRHTFLHRPTSKLFSKMGDRAVAHLSRVQATTGREWQAIGESSLYLEGDRFRLQLYLWLYT